MTNYEKIKSLSLDKMAEFLADSFEDNPRQIKDWLEEQCRQCIEVRTNYRNLKSLELDEMARTLFNTAGVDCKTMCLFSDKNGYCTYAPFDCIAALKDWLKAESESEEE